MLNGAAQILSWDGVSRQHILITPYSTNSAHPARKWRLEALCDESRESNGVFVNGFRTGATCLLRDGDIVSIGR